MVSPYDFTMTQRLVTDLPTSPSPLQRLHHQRHNDCGVVRISSGHQGRRLGGCSSAMLDSTNMAGWFNGHRNSWFSHRNSWFMMLKPIKMLVNQLINHELLEELLAYFLTMIRKS